MRVLVTGGCGFIGQHLARALVGAGHAVAALDTLLGQVHLDPVASRDAFPGPVAVGDVSEPDAWARVHGGFDTVVHLAAETGTGQSMYEPEHYHRVNVAGTTLAAGFAASRGAALVTLSSRAVYGEGRHACPDHGSTVGPACCPWSTPVASTEDDPHVPVSVYGTTKSLAEAPALEVSGPDGIPVSIVRPQNVVGPGQALHNPYTGVLAAWLAMLREGRPLTVYGDGSQTRDLVHVADLVALLAHLVETPPDPRTPLVLNSGSGVRCTLLELARYAAAAAPAPDPGIELVEVRRAGDIDHACADLTRGRAVGAPAPQRSAQTAVTDFVQWAWERPGARTAAWDEALVELRRRGLTS